MKAFFWITLLIACYTFIFYPIFLFFFSFLLKKTRGGKREKEGQNITESFWPRVSFIIAAYNEEKVIEKKLINSFELNYPAEKIEIIVVSDNSTDLTNQIVRRYVDMGVKLLELGSRNGKTSAQNEAAKLATGEILVFSDANSIWEPGALKILLKSFSNDKTGYVCGKLVYSNNDNNTGYSEGLYWKYELLLRAWESSLHSVTAGNGAIYAVKAVDYIHIPGLYCHDLELPHEMVKKGKRAVYEPGAIAVEKAAENTAEEYNRKVRMLTRTWRRILSGPSLYNPVRYGLTYSWMMVSHRLLRYLFPFLQIFLIASSIFLWDRGFVYKSALIVQSVFYLLALVGMLFQTRSKPFYIPYYFCLFHFATLMGFIYAICGKASPTWEKAESTR